MSDINRVKFQFEKALYSQAHYCWPSLSESGIDEYKGRIVFSNLTNRLSKLDKMAMLFHCLHFLNTTHECLQVIRWEILPSLV